jgi:hypothetical protein
MGLSSLPNARPLSANRPKAMRKSLQDEELMNEIEAECEASAKILQDRRVSSMADAGNPYEQHMSSNQDVAQEYEMKNWIDAKLDTDPTYQAIIDEYADL